VTAAKATKNNDKNEEKAKEVNGGRTT